MTYDTATDHATEIKSEVLDAFRGSLRGELLQPGDEGYGEARLVWNGMIDRHPQMIVKAAGVADVVAAVNFARTNGLFVGVRGGGHNWAGLGACDGGLLIDLSAMNGIMVDPVGMTVRVQGGATWGAFDHECQAFGLATTGGHVSTTGVGGLTLGGGIGWLMRSYGLVSDNLLSADMVTADGRFLTVSEREHDDLFWGIRGGGGNFGVVTSFTFRLRPLGDTVVGGVGFFPAERTVEVLRFCRDFLKDVPNELTTVIGFLTAPEAPFLPESLHGQRVVAVAVCYAGEIERGLQIVQPIKDLRPAADLIGPIPYLMQQQLFDPSFPRGLRYYIKSEYIDELSDEFIDAFAAHANAPISPLSASTIQHYGGVVRDPGPDATAYTYRDAAFAITMGPAWTDPADDDAHVAWSRDFFAAMKPFANGVYVNFLSQEDEDRVRSAYGERTYDRLVALKNRYDPNNLFRVNHNIKPTTASPGSHAG